VGGRSRGKRRGLSCRNAGHLGEEGRESQATHLVARRPIAGANGVGFGHVFAVPGFAIVAAGGLVIVAAGSVHPHDRGSRPGGGRSWAVVGFGSRGRLLRLSSGTRSVGKSDRCETEDARENECNRENEHEMEKRAA